MNKEFAHFVTLFMKPLNQNKMPDIAMCKNETCKLKKECYRYMAKPSKYWQSYADIKPNKKGECDYFIKYSLQKH